MHWYSCVRTLNRAMFPYLSTVKGFTLAELLVSLAILGVITTFTIPKVLQSQQNGKFNSIAKEAAAMVSQAYSAYQLNNTPSSSTTVGDLTSFMNYVKVDTTTTIDLPQTQGTRVCGSSTYLCLRLHNGGTVLYNQNVSFGGTGTTNAVYIMVDPDGVTDGTTNGPGKSIQFFVYYSGRLTTYGGMLPNTETSAFTYTTPNTAWDPPWFSWN